MVSRSNLSNSDQRFSFSDLLYGARIDCAVNISLRQESDRSSREYPGDRRADVLFHCLKGTLCVARRTRVSASLRSASTEKTRR